MDMTDTVNASVEVDIGGRKYRARQLTLSEMFGHFEANIRRDALDSARELAAALDGEQKREFLADVWRNMPRGSALMDRVIEVVKSPSGVVDVLWLAVRREQPDVTRDELATLVTGGTISELAPLIEYLAGVGDNPQAPSGKAKGRSAKPPAQA